MNKVKQKDIIELAKDEVVLEMVSGGLNNVASVRIMTNGSGREIPNISRMNQQDELKP
ncbi:hypothetical protein [Algicola sagamiensis]|uniref:hypothetical protein n=1 Tax=Algicola sagamiensis TaxID=163869 RepID=UPI0003648EC4|nr:hypothetical protein [Algicola sagamiensis]